jgi:VIT1/CCC1 family predicted Fe2+/Mn2+ transporter
MRRTVISARQRSARALRLQRERRLRWAIAARIAALAGVAALLARLFYPLFEDAVVSAIVSGLIVAIVLALAARSGENHLRETE